MKTLLALATGAVILPVLAGGAHARTTPAVRLETAIRTLSRTPDAVRYAVTVRPVGGTARGVTLLLGTRLPARWIETAPGCMAAGDRTVQACDLGDLRASRDLRLTGRPGRSGVVPVFARAAASGAPSVMWSLAAVRPAALAVPTGRASRPDGGEPSPSASTPSALASATADAASAAPVRSSPAESSEVSPAVESPALQSPAVESPAIQSPAVRDAPGSAFASASVPSTAEAADPEPARPLGGPARRVARPRPAPTPTSMPTARPTPTASRTSATPSPSHTASAKVSAVPDLPLTPPPLAPAVPLPSASASNALPQIAPHASPSEGVSELSTLSPAGAMQAGRWSWATLIAVAVVTEAGLLWLVAGFAVWRRKRVRKPGRRARSPRPLLSRLIP